MRPTRSRRGLSRCLTTAVAAAAAAVEAQAEAEAALLSTKAADSGRCFYTELGTHRIAQI